jgi:PIN domain nuclease of toxin-antitoxin system
MLRERIRRAGRVAVSAASVYELIQAVLRGRLRLTLDADAWVECATLYAQIQVIPIDVPIAKIAAGLPPVHGDPLDRLIIATALWHRDQLMSQDGSFPVTQNWSACSFLNEAAT